MDAVNKLLNPEDAFRVTGVMMQYFEICKRELWFEYHDIEIDRSNPHVVQGTIVDDQSYDYLNRETVRIGSIAPDMLQNGKIVEVKPSKAFEDAKKSQLKYYLWYLETKYDIEKNGVLAYPKQRERADITLENDDREEIEDKINEIYDIVTKDEPPELEKKPACDSCAYKDFCWLGDSK